MIKESKNNKKNKKTKNIKKNNLKKLIQYIFSLNNFFAQYGELYNNLYKYLNYLTRLTKKLNCDRLPIDKPISLNDN